MLVRCSNCNFSISSDYAEDKFCKSKNSKSGYHGWCKECKNKKQKHSRERNPINHRLSSLSWNKNNPKKRKMIAAKNRIKSVSKRREYYFQSEYGLSIKQIGEKKMSQDYLCAICGRHDSEFKKGLHMDHDHKTGKLRQMLCVNCNSLVALVEDKTELLIKSLNYVSYHFFKNHGNLC